ncbi:unnamed protein product [Miscanthus lutarioriparius]|uniref:Uncharacterized protein n=1 Tax=Miscanthus lutarioriparius TaxID=422564 RepID=A0A811Q1Y2_9POAL|nr:unnamed protein product [Miscanthus lutarioriparius]
MDGDGKEDANKQRLEWATMNLERGVVVGGEKNGGGNGNASRKPPIGIVRLFLACMVSGGIQYGWALQLSLLSPYSQTLGISHSYVPLTWICGPIAGFVVQPIVGYYSDRCTSKMGRRRPFILAGCIIICLSGQHGPNVGQAIFSLWMALGSVLGYLVGANAKWHEWSTYVLLTLRWLHDPYASGGSLGSKPRRAAMPARTSILKGAFLTAVILIILTMSVTLWLAGEELLDKEHVDGASVGACSAFVDLFKSLKNLPPAMFSVLAVTAVTCLSWFPFIQYNTDWMGREIFHGEPQGAGGKADLYDAGVREGAVGLLFCSISLGVTSFLIPKLCRKLTSRVVWSISNLMVFVLMTAMVSLGVVSMKGYKPSLAASLYVATTSTCCFLAAVNFIAGLHDELFLRYPPHPRGTPHTHLRAWTPQPLPPSLQIGGAPKNVTHREAGSRVPVAQNCNQLAARHEGLASGTQPADGRSYADGPQDRRHPRAGAAGARRGRGPGPADPLLPH